MSGFPRRAVLIGAAALPLAGCAKAAHPSAPTPSAGQPLAAAAAVPVGSGTIIDGVLLTQPTPGVFKGFLARCTHAGCALTEVRDDEAVCPCHGSRFTLDGAVARGPATEPLVARAISVRDGQITAS